MNALKNMINKFSDDSRLTFHRFPITAILIILVSILTPLFVIEPEINDLLFTEKIIPFLIVCGFGTFLVETIFRSADWRKWVGTGFAALISFGFVYWVNVQQKSFFGFSERMVDTNLSRYYVSYILIGICIAVYGNFRQSGCSFSEYVIKVFQNLAQIAIVSAALAAGIALVGFIFAYLILNDSNYLIIPRTEVLILGSVFGIGFLSSLINTNKEIARFFTIIVRNILLVLVIIAFAIIYVYIGKILITQVMPSNQVFRILTALFLIGLPIWTMADYFEDGHWLNKIGRILPYIFIPFIVLQGYALGLRIADNGLTPNRYLGVMLIGFEMIYILLFFIRKRKVEWILPVFAACVLIAGVLPGVNMFTVSINNQYKTVQKLSERDFGDLNSTDQRRLAGAYYYLANHEGGKQLVAGLDNETVSAIEKSDIFGWAGDQNYFYKSFSLSDLDISDFRTLSVVRASVYDSPIDLEKVPFGDDENSALLTVDLSDVIKLLIVSGQSQNEAKSEKFRIVETGDGSKLVINYINIALDMEGDIATLDLEGYWLRP